MHKKNRRTALWFQSQSTYRFRFFCTGAAAVAGPASAAEAAPSTTAWASTTAPALTEGAEGMAEAAVSIEGSRAREGSAEGPAVMVVLREGGLAGGAGGAGAGVASMLAMVAPWASLKHLEHM